MYSAKFLNSRNNSHIFSIRLVHANLQLLNVLFFFPKQYIFLQSTVFRFVGLLWRHSNSGGGCYEFCVSLEGHEVT